MLVNPTPYPASPDGTLRDTPIKKKVKGLLMDADYLAYMAGFATQKTIYTQCTEEGDYIKEVKKSELGSVDFYITDFLVEEPTKAEFIINKQNRTIKNLTNNIPFNWFLTKGSTVFRNEYAEFVKYKGNRDNSERPHNYLHCMEYMKRVFKAKVIEGIEADDIIADVARRREGEVVVCSTDKDLRTVAGLHINLGKPSKPFYVTPLEACTNFYTQVLTGDKVDNIKGVKGIGEKKAYNILRHCSTEREMIDAVIEVYSDKITDPVVGWRGKEMDYKDLLVENCNLLYLRKNPDQKFTWREDDE